MRSAATLAILSLSAADALAARGVRLTYFGDPATSIAVSWNSDDPGEATIRYGTSPTDLTMTATATATPQPAPLGTSFTARLTGLTPKTRYHYQVGAKSASFTTLSDDPCDPFRFVLIGDNRNDTGDDSNPVWEGVLAEAMAHEPAFFVNTGDMVEDGSSPAQWSSFIDASEAGWALVPSILTMGNHDEGDTDGDGALYNQLYELPRNDVTDTEDYYAIDVGPIHFVSLNTQYAGRGTAWGQMTSWLAADLAASTRTWEMAFFHKAVYSRGNHSTGEEDDGAINRGLIPLFDAEKVDFVLNGHSHNYERYVPSRGLDAAFGGSGRAFPAGMMGSDLPDPLPDGTAGTTYLVSGGAGALTTDVLGFTCMDAACTYCTGFNLNCQNDVFEKDKQGCAVYDGRHNFAVFDVAGGMLTVQVFSTTSGNTVAAEMIDEFRMVASDAALLACGGDDDGDETSGADAGAGGADGGGGQAGGDDGSSGGCGCTTGGRSGGAGGMALLAVGLALALASGSRARADHRSGSGRPRWCGGRAPRPCRIRRSCRSRPRGWRPGRGRGPSS